MVCCMQVWEGFKVQDSGFRVWGLGIEVHSLCGLNHASRLRAPLEEP